jgi:hypothetical protein
MSEVFTLLTTLLGLKKVTTSIYHAQTNTDAERKHGFLTPILKALCDGHPKRWPELLGYAEYAYNTTPVEGEGISPFEVHFGAPPTLPLDLFLGEEFKIQEAKHKGQGIPDQLKKIHTLVNKIRSKNRKSDKDRYDVNKKERVYEVGQKVLAFRPPKLVGPKKLASDMRGPYTVVRRLGTVTYELTDGTNNWPNHVSNMRAWVERDAKVMGEVTFDTLDSELPAPERAPVPPNANKDSHHNLNEHGEDDDEQLNEFRKEFAPHSVMFDKLMRERPHDEQSMMLLRNMTNKTVFFDCSTIPGAGVGAFARRPLTKGKPFTSYTGKHITKAEFEALEAEGKASRYTYEMKDGSYVDAGDYRVSGWARYINCVGPGQSPNVVVIEEDGEILVIPTRNIEVGEELLSDYGDTYWEAEEKEKGRASGERRVPPPMEVPPEWDALMQQAAEETQRQVEGKSSRSRTPSPVASWRLSTPPLPMISPSKPPASAGHAPTQPDTEAEKVLGCAEGDFLLVKMEADPHCVVVRVLSVDAHNKHLSAHVFGSYTLAMSGGMSSGQSKLTFQPCFIDTLDAKKRVVYTNRPKKHQIPYLVEPILPKEIRSTPFALSKGKLPAEWVDVVTLM